MAIDQWAPGDPRGATAPEDPRMQYADEPRSAQWAPGDPRAPAGDGVAPALRATGDATGPAPAAAAPGAAATFLPKLTAEQMQLAKMAAGVGLAWLAWTFLRDEAGGDDGE